MVRWWRSLFYRQCVLCARKRTESCTSSLPPSFSLLPSLTLFVPLFLSQCKSLTPFIWRGGERRYQYLSLFSWCVYMVPPSLTPEFHPSSDHHLECWHSWKWTWSSSTGGQLWEHHWMEVTWCNRDRSWPNSHCALSHWWAVSLLWGGKSKFPYHCHVLNNPPDIAHCSAIVNCKFRILTTGTDFQS